MAKRRAGWVSGVTSVDDIYFPGTIVGDAKCGRMLSMLPDDEIDALPPRFKKAFLKTIDWNKMILHYDLYPAHRISFNFPQ